MSKKKQGNKRQPSNEGKEDYSSSSEDDNGTGVFLSRVAKMREDEYAEIHQKIQNGTHQGYLLMRPPASLANEFREIFPKKSGSVKTTLLKVL